jgi:hypothetical protein
MIFFMLIVKAIHEVGVISVSHGGEYKHDSLWDIAPRSLIEIDRRFRGACCLHLQGDHCPDTVIM